MKNDRYILIIGQTDDIHSRAVAQRIIRVSNYIPILLNFQTFPESFAITLSDTNEDRLEFTEKSDQSCVLLAKHNEFRPIDRDFISMHEIHAIWIRRLNSQITKELSYASAEDQSIARTDSRATLDGFLFRAFARGICVQNNPITLRYVANKPLQLALAKELGLRIPRTCISNSPKEVESFFRELGETKAIVKPLDLDARHGLIYTRFLCGADLQLLPLVKNAPAIFQEYIEGDNIRCTFVDGQIWAARVVTRFDSSSVDWRKESFACLQECSLDEEIKLKLQKFMDRLGLNYGAFDFKVTPTGEIVFLEVNPGGQFLFVEVQTSYDISLSMAKLLVHGGTVTRSTPGKTRQNSLQECDVRT